MFITLSIQTLGTQFPAVPIHMGGTYSLNLDDDSDGFTLVDWRQGAASPGTKSVIDTLTLQVSGDDKDDLAANLQRLDQYITRIEEYNQNDNIFRQVRLNKQAENETNITSAKVYRAERSINVTIDREPAKTSNFIAEFTLTIERAPEWELFRITESPYQVIINPISAAGGATNFSTYAEGEVHGTRPARIERFVLRNVGGSGTLTEFWYGFRSELIGGSLSDFTSRWECSASSIYGDDTSWEFDGGGGSDGGATAGTAVQVTGWGTSTLALRSTTKAADVSLISAHYGEFTVLLRARVTDTLVAQVQLRDGLYNLGPMRSHRRFLVDSTNYMLYPAGIIKVPPRSYYGALGFYAGLFQNYALQVYAGVSSGAGNLYCDCFYLIPRNEGGVYVSGGQVSATNTVIVGHDPDDSIYAVAHGTAAVATAPTAQPTNYGLPLDGGILVMCAQRADAHNLNDNVNVLMEYNSRWDTLRGADTS